MNNKGEMGLGTIILLFMGIVVIVGAFIPQIFNEQNVMTDKLVVTDEVVSVASAKLDEGNFNSSIQLTALTNAPSGWKVTGCPLSSITVTNASGTTLTITTDYTLDTTNGILTIVNNSNNIERFEASNTSLVDYSYCRDGYNTSAGGRSSATLIGLFSTLALLSFVVYGIREWIKK